MRKTGFIAGLACLALLAGCAVPDTIFGMLGSYYTGGGTTRAERKHHYDQQVEASQHYRPWDR